MVSKWYKILILVLVFLTVLIFIRPVKITFGPKVQFHQQDTIMGIVIDTVTVFYSNRVEILVAYIYHSNGQVYQGTSVQTVKSFNESKIGIYQAYPVFIDSAEPSNSMIEFSKPYTPMSHNDSVFYKLVIE